MRLLAGFGCFVAAAGSLSLAYGEQIPEPYCSIQDLPFDNHGWFFNANELEKCMQGREIKTVIEVGSWLGSSTRFLAEKTPPDAKIYAVDTWAGTPNEAVHMQDPRKSRLYQIFLSNVKHANQTHKIVPVRMDSLEAAAALNVQADLIYIDASHDEDNVFKDIMAWNIHLKPGGILTGDDWKWDSVRRGVVKAADILGKSVESEGNFWYFKEKEPVKNANISFKEN